MVPFNINTEKLDSLFRNMLDKLQDNNFDNMPHVHGIVK